MSSIAWDGEAADGLWSSPTNWSGTVVPGSQDDVTVDVAGDVTITLRGTPGAVKSLINHETLFVEGRTSSGKATLTVTNDFTNYGTLRMETTSNDSGDRGSYLVINSGTLTNAATGTIDVRVGQGDGRSITGNVTNLGTIQTQAGTTLEIKGTNELFTQAGGAINSSGEFLLNGGTFSFTGGSLTGTVRALSSSISVSDTVTEPSTLRVVGASSKLVSDLPSSVELWVEGTNAYGRAVLTVDADVVSHGRIRLETTSNDSSDRGSYLTIASGKSLTNASDGTIESKPGQGDGRVVSGYLINQGTISVPSPLLEFVGTLDAAGGTYASEFFVRDSVIRVLAGSTTPLHLVGASNQLLTDNVAGSTLWVDGTSRYGLSKLTISDNLTNYGTIRLETTSNDSRDCGSYLTIASGKSLTNAGDGIVESRLGQGDGRLISGRLINEGAISVPTGLLEFVGTLDAAGGTYAAEFFVRDSAIRVLAGS
ncbi:MAG: hypothetical protein ACKV0T_09275, partial [Planctomycetales bacterium]